jgi:signal transduction histidine kinase
MDNIIRSFISETVMNTAAVPVIYTDSTRTRVIETATSSSGPSPTAPCCRPASQPWPRPMPPIEVSLAGRGRNYIFYEESRVITQLRYFPYVQLGIIGLFLLVSYALFSLFRNAEQNQVWVGMAKETAHQLGTPLSSLMAWMELLKDNGTDEAAVAEMRKDVDRLEVITERFSKIGSAPELVPEPSTLPCVTPCSTCARGCPRACSMEVVTAGRPEPAVPLNRPLFSWVLENLVRNAVDAMEGEGRITITTEHDGSNVHVDVADTGKGIPASQAQDRVPPRLHHQEARLGPGPLAHQAHH